MFDHAKVVKHEGDQASVGLLDVKQVAELINASTRTVYRLSDAGRMPRPVKLGALVRWSKAELDAWIAEGCPQVQADHPVDPTGPIAVTPPRDQAHSASTA